MDTAFIRDRITKLRLSKGVSEYRMSYELGHSRGYVNNISSGKVLPSMAEFLAICEYFGITPSEFFDEANAAPMQLNGLMNTVKQMDESDLQLLQLTADRLTKK